MTHGPLKRERPARRGFGLVVLLLGAVAGGCGPQKLSFVPVEGTVTKGGRPVRNVEVVFLVEPGTGAVGPRATGKTDEAGRYRLRTDNGDDGAVAGTHRVVVLDLDAARKEFLLSMRSQDLSPEHAKRVEEQLKAAAEARRVPPAFGNVNETPLRAEVGSAPLVFDIVLP
jgi:hypothetical protein